MYPDHFSGTSLSIRIQAGGLESGPALHDAGMCVDGAGDLVSGITQYLHAGVLPIPNGGLDLEERLGDVWMGIYLPGLVVIWIRKEVRPRRALAPGSTFCRGAHRKTDGRNAFYDFWGICVWLGRMADRFFPVWISDPLVYWSADRARFKWSFRVKISG